MTPFRTLAAAFKEIPRVIPLMREPAVPVAAKIATVAAAVLIVSPLDLLGDIPLLGQIDDVVLLAFLVHVFVWFAERAIARNPAPRNVTPPASEAIATR
jgi:uncharacterized membrane protein YkvA (DUF1232 family)